MIRDEHLATTREKQHVLAASSRSDVVHRCVRGAHAPLRLHREYVHSGFSQPWAFHSGPKLHEQRPWLAAGDAFGLMAWTTADGAYELFYKDDNARALLATLATAGLLRSDKWHSSLATALLGNL